MRDSSGGVVVLTIIVVFIVLVSAYLSFNVNYTKAFRMKNKIIDTIEKYNGVCEYGGKCRDEISKYSKDIGYHPYNITECPEISNVSQIVSNNVNKEVVDRNYCIYEFQVASDDGAYCVRKEGSKCVEKDTGTKYYYRVMTVIDIKIPIVQNVLGLNLMSVTGDTKYFKK